MKRGGELRFGPTTLSRLYCQECQEETLHSRGRCVHCQSQYHGVITPERPQLKNRWNANPEKGIKR